MPLMLLLSAAPALKPPPPTPSVVQQLTRSVVLRSSAAVAAAAAATAARAVPPLELLQEAEKQQQQAAGQPMVLYTPPSIKGSSTPEQLALAKHLERTGAKFYGVKHINGLIDNHTTYGRPFKRAWFPDKLNGGREGWQHSQ